MNKRAVVIGGSMAGLLAARVLADHFQEVVIVERDEFPSDPEFRNGVPQGRHVHILLAKGFVLLGKLFPGIEADLEKAGGTPMELGTECRSLMSAGWMPVTHLDIHTCACSRPLLEWVVRQRVTALPNVTVRDHADVKELTTDAAKTTITGIRVQARKRGDNTSDEISADLVVDASGRSSRLPEWLTDMGYTAPPQTIINSFLGYASRIYKRPEQTPATWKGIVLFPDPPRHGRGAVLFPIEGNRWVCTLGGAGKDYPPTDEAGYMDYARSMRDPIVYDLIKDAEPITSIYGYQKTTNQLRYYEKLSRFPKHLIALGDSVCAFNPIYGQGMTTAALGAMVLSRELTKAKDNLAGFGRSFQAALAKENTDPWLLATSTDLLYPTTEGGQASRLIGIQQAYLNAIVPLMLEDPILLKEFLEVFHLLKPPSALVKPGRVLHLIRRKIVPRRAAQPTFVRPGFD